MAVWFLRLCIRRAYDVWTLYVRNCFLTFNCRTVVSQWVLFQLAVHPEYLEPLREELSRISEQNEDGTFHLTFASLREARLLDSFIREVMRLKGDTISTMRYTTCDVPLGDVVIPKGVRTRVFCHHHDWSYWCGPAQGHFVTPMSTTVHENPEVFGDDSTLFNGFQWAEQNKDAVMTGPAHIVFGLGRFACPGRLLAINGEHYLAICIWFSANNIHPTELKLIVLTLIGRATPSLLEGHFEVTDPLNTVTQPPKGTLFMVPLEKPILWSGVRLPRCIVVLYLQHIVRKFRTQFSAAFQNGYFRQTL